MLLLADTRKVPKMSGIYGSTLKSSPYAYADERAVYRGYKYIAQADAMNIYDEQIDEKLVYVQGSKIWVNNPNLGDYIEFSIVDKNDTLGLFTENSLTKEGDVLEVQRWTHNIYLPPWSCEKELITKTAFETISGLYLRVCYVNVGLNDVDFAVEYLGYEK